MPCSAALSAKGLPVPAKWKSAGGLPAKNGLYVGTTGQVDKPPVSAVRKTEGGPEAPSFCVVSPFPFHQKLCHAAAEDEGEHGGSGYQQTDGR